MIDLPDMQKLLEAGVHFGHRVRRGNPHMQKYIFGARDGVHIIDLAKSEEKLKEAANFAFELGQRGATLLIVGTKKQSKELIKTLANEAEAAYLTERWVGGMLTNFDEIRKNIKKLTDLKEEKIKGELSRYTKKEQLLIDRKLQKFDRELGGVANLTKLPDAVFVIDTASDFIAVKEANRVGVKVVGLSDTNSDPDFVDYPIPANDDGIKSIKLICQTIIKAFIEGQKKAKSLKDKAEKAEAKRVEKEALKKDEEEKIPDEVASLEEEIEIKTLEESERKTV